jgi:putative transposase
MRHAQGGGLTTERRRFRERIRYEAGERFARGEKNAVIAKDLRVSDRSAERWRRAWRQGGMDALASAGPPKLPKLSDGQFAELEKELALGPAEHGWEDRRCTVARIRAVIAWKFQVDCSMAAVWRLLHRHDWSWQSVSRLIYRLRRHRKCRGKGRNSFAWSDYRDLVVRAHIQLKAPIVLVWDNLTTHRAAGMREYAVEHDGLTIVQLPSYAPDLNPVEGIWSLLRRGPLANVAFTDGDRWLRHGPGVGACRARRSRGG